MGEETPTKESAVEEERCPGCRGLIIDGVCPFCTLPIPGMEASAHEEEMPQLPTPPPVPPPPLGLRIGANALAVLPALYWLGIGSWILWFSVDNRPGPGGFIGMGFAIICLVVGLYACRAAWSMLRLSYSAQGQVVFASVLGIAWAVFLSLAFEYWLFSLVIAVHLIVGILALKGTRFFVRTPW